MSAPNNYLILIIFKLSIRLKYYIHVLFIIEPPPSPSHLHITAIHNGGYVATIELSWDFIHVNYNTYHTVSTTLNGRETWLSTTMEEQKIITLSCNVNYSFYVMTTNRAGHSEFSSLTDVFISKLAKDYLRSWH